MVHRPCQSIVKTHLIHWAMLTLPGNEAAYVQDLRNMQLLIITQGLRVDGRRPPELRRLQCQLGVFQQADGSAFLEQGNTKVLATVYGPHDVRELKISHTFSQHACNYVSRCMGNLAKKRHKNSFSVHCPVQWNPS